MKTHFPLRALLALPLLAMTAARAAYDSAIIAADARWVLYADLNGLRASTLGKELVTAIEKMQTEATGGIIGVNVPKLLSTIGSVTAYGTNLSPKPENVDGALIARGTADLRKILESVMLQGTLAEPKTFSEVSDLPFPAYAISDPKAPEETRTQLIVAFPPEPIVLVSKSKAQLQKARDVFRGAAPSLAKTPGSPLAKLTATAKGAYLFSASVVPTEPIFPQNAPQGRLLQLANSGAVAFGERGADTYVHAELVASSETNAEKLMKILQGMVSMLSLAESNDKQLAEFLNSAAVSREKNTVTFDLAYSSTRLAQLVDMIRAQAEPPRPRTPPISNGKAIAEWTAEASPQAEGDAPEPPRWRTIENVTLENGSTITVGRALNGGKHARFERVEIAPAEGAGAPMVFRLDLMRQTGGRGTMWQFPFPGADGRYTIKVAYVNDPEGKAKYAVSVREPRASQAPQPPQPPAADPKPKTQ